MCRFTSLLGLLCACSPTPVTEPDKWGGDWGDPHNPDCVESDLVVERPFSGPGWDSESGLTADTQATYVAHATAAQMTDAPAFMAMAEQVDTQLMSSKGLIGFSWGYSRQCSRLRTVGLWTNADVIDQFAYTGSHMDAVEEFENVAADGSTGHWEMAAEDIPPTLELGLCQCLTACQMVFSAAECDLVCGDLGTQDCGT